MTLAHVGTEVTGTGALFGVGTYPLNIHRGVGHGVLSVGLADSGYYAATCSGTENGGQVTCALDNSGFQDVPLVAARQQLLPGFRWHASLLAIARFTANPRTPNGTKVSTTGS